MVSGWWSPRWSCQASSLSLFKSSLTTHVCQEAFGKISSQWSGKTHLFEVGPLLHLSLHPASQTTALGAEVAPRSNPHPIRGEQAGNGHKVGAGWQPPADPWRKVPLLGWQSTGIMREGQEGFMVPAMEWQPSYRLAGKGLSSHGSRETEVQASTWEREGRRNRLPSPRLWLHLPRKHMKLISHAPGAPALSSSDKQEMTAIVPAASHSLMPSVQSQTDTSAHPFCCSPHWKSLSWAQTASKGAGGQRPCAGGQVCSSSLPSAVPQPSRLFQLGTQGTERKGCRGIRRWGDTDAESVGKRLTTFMLIRRQIKPLQ